MASACARTIGSLTSLAKWFQLFQPIGGVGASFTFCAALIENSSPEKIGIAKERLPKMFIYSSTKLLDAFICFDSPAGQKWNGPLPSPGRQTWKLSPR